jgi:hypothetical protein
MIQLTPSRKSPEAQASRPFLSNGAVIGLTVAFGLTLLVLGLSPAFAPPAGLAPIAHLAGFAVLIMPIATLRPGWVWVALILFAAFGGLIEGLQIRTGRDGSFQDAITNVVGLVLGMICGSLSRRIAPLTS